jgi:DNA polymerase I-like protein with 3'-5' exonuclease and polymerase domains
VSQGALFDITPVEEIRGPFRNLRVNFENREAREDFERLLGRKLTFESGAKTDGLEGPQSVPLFDGVGELPWQPEWTEMPECVQEDLRPEFQTWVPLDSEAEVQDFGRLIGQPDITSRTRSIWHPDQETDEVDTLRWYSQPRHDPRHPIYIISKGRADTRLTSKTLEACGVPYHIVVEPQEADTYRAVIDPAKVLVLPFSNLGLGSIPARNWCWEHALASGARRHWIMDDNIRSFYRLNRNRKIRMGDGSALAAMEDFTDRYSNVAISGPNYAMFAPRKWKWPAFRFNRRVYSCILIKNDLPHRWRGRYNEDTDLCLRALKDGCGTFLFMAFLCEKMATMTMGGGNTESLYKLLSGPVQEQDPKWAELERRAIEEHWYLDPRDAKAGDGRITDGRWRMAVDLCAQHPDVTKMTQKWGRWQHTVVYSGFAGNDPGRPQDPAAPIDYELSLIDTPKPPKPRPVSMLTVVAMLDARTCDACRHAHGSGEMGVCTNENGCRCLISFARPVRIEVGPRPLRLEPRPEGWEPDALPNLAGYKGPLGFDFETSGLKWWRGDRPVGLAVAWGTESRYFPFGHADGNLPEERVREWMRETFRGRQLAGHNIKFDAHHAREWGVDLEQLNCKLSCTMGRVGLLDDHRQRGTLNLDDVAWDFLGERKVAHEFDMSRMADYPGWQIAPYGRKDGALALRLLLRQQTDIDAQELNRIADIEDDVLYPTMEMERNGLRINVEKLRAWTIEYQRDLTLRRLELMKAVGWPIDVGKASDIARLFRERGLRTTERTEKGNDSYAGSVLEAAAKSDEVVGMAHRLRNFENLGIKFLLPYTETVGDDGIMRFALHPLMNDEHGTISGRFSGSKADGEGCNPQQVFSVERQQELHGDRFLIRELFEAPPGTLFLRADAKQIEYRVFVHMSRSERLIQSYRDDPEVDFHDIAGEMIRPFRPDFKRKRIKITNFAKLFGAGTSRIAEMFGCSQQEAEEFIGIYDRALPETRTTLRLAMDIAQERGFVRTILGRRTRFPNRQRLHKALNGAVSGTAADLNKLKVVHLHKERMRLGLTLRCTIHDEFVGDVPDLEAARLVSQVLAHQELPLSVPILWDMKTGRNWAECK